MATLGTEESGHYREVAVVRGLNNSECMDFLPKKNGRCGEVAFSGGWTVPFLTEKAPLLYTSL